MALACGCIPDKSGYGYCGTCTSALRRKIWENMSEDKKAFDRHVDPVGSRMLDTGFYGERGCSCHINPPCGLCEHKQDWEDEDEQDTIELCA